MVPLAGTGAEASCTVASHWAIPPGSFHTTFTPSDVKQLTTSPVGLLHGCSVIKSVGPDNDHELLSVVLQTALIYATYVVDGIRPVAVKVGEPVTIVPVEAGVGAGAEICCTITSHEVAVPASVQLITALFRVMVAGGMVMFNGLGQVTGVLKLAGPDHLLLSVSAHTALTYTIKGVSEVKPVAVNVGVPVTMVPVDVAVGAGAEAGNTITSHEVAVAASLQLTTAVNAVTLLAGTVTASGCGQVTGVAKAVGPDQKLLSFSPHTALTYAT